MAKVIQGMLPALAASRTTEAKRKAIVQSIAQIVESLQVRVVPFGLFLVIPLMGSMTDRSEEVRQLASSSFAEVVQLLPLDRNSSLPSEFPDALVKQKAREGQLLDQLLDPSCAADFPLALEINAELRPYQQAGVNWLGFLYKSNLHGVLCDDMGLGKTLQSICIVASSCVELRGTGNVLASLIVVPSTLVSHWVAEFTRFCGKQIRVATHVGPRRSKTSLPQGVDVIVTSYDSLRSDTTLFTGQQWNWMVLDEGHVIRNANSKISIAVKQVHAHHRLVLSGTPIQNSLLELWSIFDFLMPGFLGTRQHYNASFVKVLDASRKPKASAQDHEAGAAALARLHRQVLPFLLRRMKTDVLNDLPPKIIQDYQVELSDVQRQLYTHFSETQLSNVLDKEQKGGQVQHIFQVPIE